MKWTGSELGETENERKKTEIKKNKEIISRKNNKEEETEEE